MLRVSRLSLFLLPNSRSPELPNFLVTTDSRQAAHKTVNDLLVKTVIEYDHQKPMPDHFDEADRTLFFASSAFSASKLAPGLATIGTLLFFYTFIYNIGKPVVDAHRELLYAQPPEDDEEEDEALKQIMEEEDEFQ